jgi:PAS domain S-box-containing protein
MATKSKKAATPRTLARDKHGSGVIPTVRNRLRPLSEPPPPVEDAQAELARTRSERDVLRARYQDLQDSLPVGHLTLDVLGTILEANLAAASLFGRDPNQLVGRKIAAFVGTADAEALSSHRQHVLATAARASCDVTLHRPDGSMLSVAVETRATRSGECCATLIETQERHKQEQARRMQSIAAVTAGVAHDFNNLLTGIVGFAESCLAQLEPDHGARGRLEEILSAALTGATLVRRLMTVGQASARSAGPAHFDSVVRMLAPLLRRLIGDQLELDLELGADDANVQCESGQIEQVVLNLVINARQAIHETGRIEIRTKEIEVPEDTGSGLVPGKYVELIVRDDGCGMDEATLQHALDPFYTTKGRGEGTGLGLSTVAAIVNQANGRIELRSERDRGTEVTVLLPKQGLGPRVERRVADRRGKGRVETILLVEDEPLVRAAARDHLQKAGYRVLCASNGREALVTCENNPEIDLLLTDMLLPAGLSGVRLARLIQAHAPRAAVAFMSAYPASALRTDGLLGHNTDSLEKPFTRDELLRHVRAALKG